MRQISLPTNFETIDRTILTTVQFVRTQSVLLEQVTANHALHYVWVVGLGFAEKNGGRHGVNLARQLLYNMHTHTETLIIVLHIIYCIPSSGGLRPYEPCLTGGHGAFLLYKTTEQQELHIQTQH